MQSRLNLRVTFVALWDKEDVDDDGEMVLGLAEAFAALSLEARRCSGAIDGD